MNLKIGLAKSITVFCQSFFCIAGDHGKWGTELMGDIGDDFLSKNIGAGGKIIFCEPVHCVLDCKDWICEIFGVSGGGGAPAGR